MSAIGAKPSKASTIESGSSGRGKKQMAETKIRAGIVGLGLVATSHLKGYKSHPRAEVGAVCDSSRERAEEFATKHAIPTVYSSLEDMLADPSLNAIDIATPTYLHAP